MAALHLFKHGERGERVIKRGFGINQLLREYSGLEYNDLGSS